MPEMDDIGYHASDCNKRHGRLCDCGWDHTTMSLDDGVSPIRDGVASMPVPRCETCAHWEPWQRDKGNCNIRSLLVQYDVLLTHKDFGCVEWKGREPAPTAVGLNPMPETRTDSGFDVWLDARCAEDENPAGVRKHHWLLYEAYEAGRAEVTALRAALEQAVKTCRQCGGRGLEIPHMSLPEPCRQCTPWRALLETPTVDHA